MDKSKLRQIIREEIQKLTERINPNKKYTAKDLYKFIKSGEDITIYTGYDTKVYRKYDWDKTGVRHIKDFENEILKNRKYKGKKFIPDFKYIKNRFEVEGAEQLSAAAAFYDDMQTRRGGGIYKGD